MGLLAKNIRLNWGGIFTHFFFLPLIIFEPITINHILKILITMFFNVISIDFDCRLFYITTF
jgi:hypothetical protein